MILARLRAAFSYADAVIWTLGLTSALLLSLTLLHQLTPLANELAVGGAVEVVLYAAASVALVGRGRGAGRELGLTRAPLGLLLAGAVLGVSLHGLTDLIQFAVERVFPTPEAVLEAQVERLVKGGAVERAVVGLFVCLLAPFVEELFFRGAIHARLSPGRRALPVGITTAVCFTLSHAEPRIWPALLLIGLALAVLRRASESLVPCYLLHAAFNATTLIFVWSDPNPSNQSGPSVYVVCGAGAVAIALLAWVAQRARAEASR